MLDRKIPVPTFFPPNEASFTHGGNASPFFTIVELVTDLTIRAAEVLDTAMRVRQTLAMNAVKEGDPIEGFAFEGPPTAGQRDITDLIDSLDTLGHATSDALSRLTRCAPQIVSQWSNASAVLVNQLSQDGDDIRMASGRMIMQLQTIDPSDIQRVLLDTLTHESWIDGAPVDDDDIDDDDDLDDLLSCGEGCECAAAAAAAANPAEPFEATQSPIFDLRDCGDLVTDDIPGAVFMFLITDQRH